MAVVKRFVFFLVFSLIFGSIGVPTTGALVTAHTLTIDSATDTIDLGESATAILNHDFVALAASDRVQLNALVTSGNSTNAGKVVLSVLDSFTSSGNDGTAANSPRYNFGGEDFNDIGTITDSQTLGLSVGGNSPFDVEDSVTLGFSQAGETAVYSGFSISSTGVYAKIRVRDNEFLPSRYDGGQARDSLTISAGAADSNTVGVANRNYGTQIRVELYKPTKAGVYEITVFAQTSDNGAGLQSSDVAVKWTVTVEADAATAATAASSVTLRNGDAAALRGSGTWFGGTAEGTDSQTLASRSTSTTTTTPGFSLVVKQKDGLTSASGNLAQESYTVQVSGEAWVTAGTTTGGDAAAATVRPTSATGVKWLQMATYVADSPTVVRVWSTGTAGTATLTVTSAAGVILGTKTVTFHGPVTALAVTKTTKKVIQSGSATASTAVFEITATDAGGRAVTGLSPAIISSNVAAIASGSCADAVGAVTNGVYSCDVTPVVTSTSGAAATLTARVADPADLTGATYLTATYDVTMGGAVSTFVLTTDKATYDSGEAMVVTATAKDASGNTPYDGQAGPTIRANKALGGTAAGSSITMNAYYDGVSTSQSRTATAVRTMTNDVTLFAPAASGVFSISGLDGQTTPASVSVSATVGDDASTAAATAASDAALEAIDAANAATDAANLAAEAADAATVAAEEARDAADAATAAVEALATEVATLMAALKAQITTLSKTVAKIAKKVKA